MPFVRSTITYGLLLYVLSLSSTLALGLFGGELPAPNTPGVVDRADGWPESKARHMQEGDFWYWVETKTVKAQQDPSSWAGLLYASALGTTPNSRGLSDGALVDEFHEFEIVVWSIALPGMTFLLFGMGVAAWKKTPWWLLYVSLAGTILLTAYCLTLTSNEFYFILWDSSIHLSNLLGWTYYDFNVRFFIYAPALTMLAGIGLLVGAGIRNSNLPYLGSVGKTST